MGKKLEKQLEFDFYREIKEAERYQRSFSRVLWDRSAPVYKEILSWALAVTTVLGTVYALAHGQEIQDCFRNLF